MLLIPRRKRLFESETHYNNYILSIAEKLTAKKDRKEFENDHEYTSYLLGYYGELNAKVPVFKYVAYSGENSFRKRREGSKNVNKLIGKKNIFSRITDGILNKFRIMNDDVSEVDEDIEEFDEIEEFDNDYVDLGETEPTNNNIKEVDEEKEQEAKTIVEVSELEILKAELINLKNFVYANHYNLNSEENKKAYEDALKENQARDFIKTEENSKCYEAALIENRYLDIINNIEDYEQQYEEALKEEKQRELEKRYPSLKNLREWKEENPKILTK